MTTGEKVRGGEDDNGAAAMSESSLSHTLSRTSHPRTLDRIRSQNGYGVDDDSDPAPGDGGEAHEETASPGGSKDPYEVGWDGGDNDPLCPRSFSKGRKWLITFIVSHVSLCVTCASSIYTSTYTKMEPEFHNSRIVSVLGLSTFVLGIALGPMFLSPLSEFYGRRPIYLVSWTTYVIFLIPQAVAKNIATMLVFRFFDGFTGSAFLAVSGGTVGDLFARHELQAPMALFSVSPFVGPSLGPLLGGFINYNADWRWTYYVLLIWSGLVWGAVVFFVPETYHPILLRNKAKKLRQGTGDDRWLAPMEKVHKSVVQAVGRSLRRPFELLIFEPMCLNLCLFSALLLGILYLFFGAFPLVFGTNYGFNVWQVGTSFLGIFVGMILGVLTDPVWHRVRTRLVQKLETETGIPGASEPEFRLPPAIMGAFLVPAGIFMFGWSTYPWVHWIVPIIGSCIFAIGYVVVPFVFLISSKFVAQHYCPLEGCEGGVRLWPHGLLYG
ncbi:major facilitator superfamily transporter, partial [Metarhizium majus ARSEF 297]